ncbi:MAG: LysM peptidoglycan-binding domain-containing protein, partial [Thioploca sp.]|nr:LysM peptidoglycan-binding domain-containing protein [Thioploca sp.]
MMMHKLAATLALLIGTLFARDIYALGLSHIQVYSKLNEPLNAKINVLAIPKGSIASLKVDLASTSAFNRAGIERPYVLTAIRFNVEPVGKTDAVIRLTTIRPLKEPFLNFLVEVTWPSGRILREYTVLLDPPLYRKKPPTVTARSSKAQPQSPRTTGSKSTSSSTQRKGTRTTGERHTSLKGAGSYTVNPSDTLWKIALQTQPSGKNAHQHMINIYNANPHAFIRNDMNLIKAGANLRIPEWNGETTQQQASPPIEREEQDTQKEPGGAILPPPTPSTLEEESGGQGILTVTTPEIEQPKLERTLGTGSRPSAESAEVEGLQKQVNQLTEKNVSIEAENKDLKAKLSAIEKLATDTKKEVDNLIKARSDLLAKLQELGDLQTQLAQLQTQLKEKDKENEDLKKQLAEAKTTPEKVAEQPSETTPTVTKVEPPKEEVAEQPGETTPPVVPAEPPKVVAEEPSETTHPRRSQTRRVAEES